MKRRNFIKSAAIFGVISSLLIVPSFASAKDVIKWKMVTTWQKNFPVLGTGANQLAKLIGEMSGGRIKVKVYGGGELVPAMEVFDAVSRGTAEMGHGSAYYWKGKVEEAPFFSPVPFGMNGPRNARLVVSRWWYGIMERNLRAFRCRTRCSR